MELPGDTKRRSTATRRYCPQPTEQHDVTYCARKHRLMTCRGASIKRFRSIKDWWRTETALQDLVWEKHGMQMVSSTKRSRSMTASWPETTLRESWQLLISGKA